MSVCYTPFERAWGVCHILALLVNTIRPFKNIYKKKITPKVS